MPPFEDLSREELIQKAREQWYELENLKRLLYGVKAERFTGSAAGENQLKLDLEGTNQSQPIAPVAPDEQIEKARQEIEKLRPAKALAQRGKQARQLLPASLKREIIVLEPPQDVQGMKKIGTLVTEVLEYRAGELYVKRYERPKYALPEGEGVIVASLPSRPIEKGIAGASLLTHILVSKFVDHLPLDRQIKMLRRNGIILPDATAGGWIPGACSLIQPLYKLLGQSVVGCSYVQIDETPIGVLDKKTKGKTHRGYHWVIHAPPLRAVYVSYHPGRDQDWPKGLLQGFEGHVQSDAYVAYNQFEKNPLIILHGCWAHVRRKFFEAQGNDRERSEWMLQHIQWLYTIEDFARINKYDPAQRQRLRQEKAPAVLETIHNWLLAEQGKTLPSSLIGKAIAYALNNWSRLANYIQDGRVEIDNNLVENAIRPIALGRKNYLFAGSHDSARNAAMIYSFFATCAKHDINPNDWLTDILERLPDHPVNRLAELLPQNWSMKSS